MVKEETKEEIPENRKKFEDFFQYEVYEYNPPTSEEVNELNKKRLDFIEKKMKEYEYDNEVDLFEDERWHEAIYDQMEDITDNLVELGWMDPSFLEKFIECENDDEIQIIEIMIQGYKELYSGLKSKAKSEDFFKKLHLIFDKIAAENYCLLPMTNRVSYPCFYVGGKSGKLPNTNIYRLYIEYGIF